MNDSTLPLPGLSPVLGKPLMARFDGGPLSSDAGVLVLREAEQRLGAAERLAGCSADPRAQNQVVHGHAGIIRFRMLMIAAGYEDGNDASSLRSDPAFKLAQGAPCHPVPILPRSRPSPVWRTSPIAVRCCAWGGH